MEHGERADRELPRASAGGGITTLRSGGEPDTGLRRLRRMACCLVASAAVLALGGCVREKVDGAAREFSYVLWVPLTIIGVGILVAGAGIALLILRPRRPVNKWGFILLLLGGYVGCYVGPMYLAERTFIDDSRFRVTAMNRTYEVDLDSLRGVRIVKETEKFINDGEKGGPRMIKHYVLCECVGGATVKIPIWDYLQQAVRPHFLKKVSDRGIPIRDET